MANEELIARWQYTVDPSVTQIFAPLKQVSEGTGGQGERIINNPEHPTRLLVVRNDFPHTPILLQHTDMLPFELWEISSHTHGELSKGTITIPPGFERISEWSEVPKQAGASPAALLESLRLQNFRCFEGQSFAFSKQFNVLIGNNGAGKTAVLDAIAHTLQQIVGWLDPLQKDAPAQIFLAKDVRRILMRDVEIPTTERCYPATIDPRFFLYGEPDIECGWQVTKNERSEWLGTGKIITFANIIDFVRILLGPSHRRISLPLFAYYRVNRRWNDTGSPQDRSRDDTTRMAGYKNWNNPTSDLRDLEQWMMRLQLLENQKQTRIGTYQAVKDAILISLGGEGFVDVQFDAELDQLAAKKPDGPWIPFRSLSDGVQNILGLFADLAIRCARLNPHLGEDAPKQTGGIVLIDELDLHLHPTWQRRIAENLRAAFPQLQFIATTHSPFIVQSLRPGELIDLGKSGAEYYRQSLEEIAEFVMGVETPSRDRRWLAMKEAAKEYFRVLQKPSRNPEEIERSKAKLDELILPYADDPAYAAFLEMKRLAAGLGKDAGLEEDAT